jgi:hypothetical protein
VEPAAGRAGVASNLTLVRSVGEIGRLLALDDPKLPISPTGRSSGRFACQLPSPDPPARAGLESPTGCETGRPLEETGWADAAGRASANGSAPGRPEAPPRAAADQPEQDEGDPRRRGGEHKHRQHGDDSERHDHRSQ